MIGRFLLGRERAIFVERRRNPAVLHLRQLFIIIGDPVQRLENPRLERGLHRREAHIGLIILVLVIIRRDRVAIGIELLGALGFLARRLAHIGGDHGGLVILVIAELIAKGRLEIDHIAQQNVFGQKFVAPDGDRLKGQRALAEPEDHRVATRLDALGNGDLALAAEQLDRAHLAQIHAHRVIRPVELFFLAGPKRDLAALAHFSQRRHPLLFFLDILGLDDVDAHLAEHRHDIFDLFRRHLIGRQRLVQLVIGDVALLARLGDHLLDRRLAQIQRNLGILIIGFLIIVVLGGHEMLLSWGATGDSLPTNHPR